jgi:hypothetical protein
MMIEEKIDQTLSEDWLKLVKDAMQSDVTKEEFKRFLEEKSKKIK